MLQSLQTCAGRLFPNLPAPPDPHTRPLASHAGHFHDPGYGDIYVHFECDNSNLSRPQMRHDGDTCSLRVTIPEGLEINIYADLEHKTGDHWIAWAYIPEYEDPDQPVACMRAQFRVNTQGQVAQFGLDLRLEGEDVPLVWFDRVVS